MVIVDLDSRNIFSNIFHCFNPKLNPKVKNINNLVWILQLKSPLSLSHQLYQTNDLMLQTLHTEDNILKWRKMKNYIIKVKYGDPVRSQFQVNSHTFHRELLLHEFCSNCKMFCVKIIPFFVFEYLKFDKTKIGNKCSNSLMKCM